MTTSNEHNNAPAVPQGWKLVPVEPSPEMMEAMPGMPAIGAPGDMDLKNKGWSLKAIQNRHRWIAALAATPAPAPAQYKDSTPHLSVGESSFEYWFESYNPANKGDKQRARDAYAAGMGDPLVTAKPAQEVGLTNHQFDLICQAIDKADTATMDGDYMLDSDDCIAVVRIMQVLFDVDALRAKEQS